MKISTKTIVLLFLLAAVGCEKEEEPKKIECGCEGKKQAVADNVAGKIEFDTSDPPVTYVLHGYFSTGLMVCVDSTFERLRAQNKIVNSDSIVFAGELKHPCNDCEFCGFISVTSMSRK